MLYRGAKHRLFTALSLLVLLLPATVSAHFQELIPSTDSLNAGQGRSLELAITFTHPMEQGPVMAMDQPLAFGVLIAGQRLDLSKQLAPVQRQNQPAFNAHYSVRRPGDHIFYLSPAPYWEANEGKFIQHHTKVVVDAFSAHEGWDALVGLPVEIEPLVRPYGLWTGNQFRGIVRKAGQPVPFATVEVEWRNDGSLHAPNDAYITQVIKADGNGVFSYGLPRAGWWGFAALIEGEPQTTSDGTQEPVEEAGLIWVYARDMQDSQ